MMRPMDKTRVLLFASVVAAAMIFGGVLGATVLARSTVTPASAALAAASPSPTPQSNEAATHEAGESAAQETAERSEERRVGKEGRSRRSPEETGTREGETS